MKAAIVRGAGQTPVYADFAEPVPSSGERSIAVTAAAISNVVKARASGTHYSSSGQFPFVVGIDDGSRVYFILPRAPYGSMAERASVPAAQCLPLPDGLDDVTAAAIANPGMSSWAAYVERARLKAGETVLVNGAAGTAGRLAVQIAKHLGAKRVIATGRNVDALRAECLMVAGAKAGAEAVPIRFVQIGSVSGSNITLPSAVLRSSAIELMGSGIGSIPLSRLIDAVGELLKAALPGGLRIATKSVPLSEVEQAWPVEDSSRRTVLTVALR